MVEPFTGPAAPVGPAHGDAVEQRHQFLGVRCLPRCETDDQAPGMEYRSGSSITVCLSGDTASPLREYWEKLADGGVVQVPLEKQMWGDHFGQLTDRFGTAWMVNIGQPQG